MGLKTHLSLAICLLLVLAACDNGSDSRAKTKATTALTATEAVEAMKRGDFTPLDYANVLLDQGGEA